MKVIKNIENKYYFTDEDVRAVEEALNFRNNKTWLADQMGFTYKTLWAKMNNHNGSYFDQLEVEKLEYLLKIKLL